MCLLDTRTPQHATPNLHTMMNSYSLEAYVTKRYYKTPTPQKGPRPGGWPPSSWGLLFLEFIGRLPFHLPRYPRLLLRCSKNLGLDLRRPRDLKDHINVRILHPDSEDADEGYSRSLQSKPWARSRGTESGILI